MRGLYTCNESNKLGSLACVLIYKSTCVFSMTYICGASNQERSSRSLLAGLKLMIELKRACVERFAASFHHLTLCLCSVMYKQQWDGGVYICDIVWCQ